MIPDEDLDYEARCRAEDEREAAYTDAMRDADSLDALAEASEELPEPGTVYRHWPSGVEITYRRYDPLIDRHILRGTQREHVMRADDLARWERVTA